MPICPTCELMTSTTWVQWRNRSAKITAYPHMEISPCRDCGGVDYMLSLARLPDEEEPDELAVPAWAIMLTAIIIGLALWGFLAWR